VDRDNIKIDEGCDRVSKHNSIMESIERLDNSSSKLNNLLDEITGGARLSEAKSITEPTKESQKSQHTLSHVLENASDLISGQSEKINHLINEMRTYLF
jgi:hypothetical protein